MSVEQNYESKWHKEFTEKMELQDKLVKVNIENAANKREKEELVREKEKLKYKIETLKKSIEKQELDKLKQEKKELEDKLNQLQEDYDNLLPIKQKNEQLEQELSVKEKEIQIYIQAINNASLILNKKEEETKKQIKSKKENK